MDKSSYSLPPLEWVRAFEAAARLGSFTAAAQETGLTQPAISQRIGQLEKHLGTQLFLREARTISLTVEGETWLPHVQSALRALSDSTETLFARGRSRLTISASQSVISMWLAPRLARASAATSAELSVQSYVLGGQTASTEAILQIRYGAGDWPQHYQVPLFSEIMAPVCAPGLARRDWTGLPRIACTGPRPDWDAFAARFGIPSIPIPNIRVDTLHGAIAAAKAGQGVALGSLALCRDDIENGSLVRLGDEALDNTETYWLLAERSAISKRQWTALAQVLTERRE
ncbi:LysR family transcriptional regulator [Cognatishimia sp.]|uniref:LysR family transcriptional regulator n=1 Tax=Cognatishimia sp. TaxID=2211648 RepID=UPI0035191FC3